MRRAVACPTMPASDGLIGSTQRLPAFIVFEAEMRLLQCEAWAQARVINQADLCKFAGCLTALTGSKTAVPSKSANLGLWFE